MTKIASRGGGGPALTRVMLCKKQWRSVQHCNDFVWCFSMVSSNLILLDRTAQSNFWLFFLFFFFFNDMIRQICWRVSRQRTLSKILQQCSILKFCCDDQDFRLVSAFVMLVLYALFIKRLHQACKLGLWPSFYDHVWDFFVELSQGQYLTANMGLKSLPGKSSLACHCLSSQSQPATSPDPRSWTQPWQQVCLLGYQTLLCRINPYNTESKILIFFNSGEHFLFRFFFSSASMPIASYFFVKVLPWPKNWDNRAHVAQARDLSSMHASMFGLRACLNFFGQGSIWVWVRIPFMTPSNVLWFSVLTIEKHQQWTQL